MKDKYAKATTDFALLNKDMFENCSKYTLFAKFALRNLKAVPEMIQDNVTPQANSLQEVEGL